MNSLLENSLFLKPFYAIKRIYEHSFLIRGITGFVNIFKASFIYKLIIAFLYRTPSIDNSLYKKILYKISDAFSVFFEYLNNLLVKCLGSSISVSSVKSISQTHTVNKIRYLGIFLIFMGLTTSFLQLVNGSIIISAIFAALFLLGLLIFFAAEKFFNIFSGSILVKCISILLK